MAARPTAHVLHGFLGVGKTTFAKRLEQERKALRFTHDDWMGQLYGNDPPTAEFGDLAGRVSTLMEQVWTRCLRLGIDVILDFGFWTRAERVEIRRLVTECGGEAILYRLNCPGDVARRRISRRNRHASTGLYIAPATYHALRAGFEPLGDDEPFIDVSA